MTESDVLTRADAWQQALEARDVDGIADFLHDDYAMVLHSADQQATVFGNDRSGRFVVSDCWLRGPDGAWRVWRRHSTPLQAGSMPRSAAD